MAAEQAEGVKCQIGTLFYNLLKEQKEGNDGILKHIRVASTREEREEKICEMEQQRNTTRCKKRYFN